MGIRVLWCHIRFFWSSWKTIVTVEEMSGFHYRVSCYQIESLQSRLDEFLIYFGQIYILSLVDFHITPLLSAIGTMELTNKRHKSLIYIIIQIIYLPYSVNHKWMILMYWRLWLPVKYRISHTLQWNSFYNFICVRQCRIRHRLLHSKSFFVKYIFVPGAKYIACISWS